LRFAALGLYAVVRIPKTFQPALFREILVVARLGTTIITLLPCLLRMRQSELADRDQHNKKYLEQRTNSTVGSKRN
jgi:hypothetical protein